MPNDPRLPSAQDLWDTLYAVLIVVGVDPATGSSDDWPDLKLPPTVARHLADPLPTGLPSQQYLWETLLDTLNTVGYPETFAEQHPTWTVAQGVAQFLKERVPLADRNDQPVSAMDRWTSMLSGDRAISVRAWLNEDPSIARTAFFNGKTPLMLAADKNAEQCVHALLPFSDARAVDDLDFNALMFAVRRNAKPGILSALIPVSDLAVADRDGHTVLHHLTDNGRLDALREVLARLTPDQVNGLDREAHERHSVSPLLVIAASVSLDLVNALLPCCDPDRADKDGWTPLMMAALMNKPDIVERLGPVSTLTRAPLPDHVRALLDERGEPGAKALAMLEQEVRRHEQRVLHQTVVETAQDIDSRARPRL